MADAADVQLSTLDDGAVVTIAGVSTLSGFATSFLTDDQGRTVTGLIMTLSGNSSRPAGTNNAAIGKSDTEADTSTGGGLSKTATIGLGVGLGLFALLLIGGIFTYRWWSKRKRQHSRAPSIIISGPLEAKKESSSSRPDTPTYKMPELGGGGGRYDKPPPAQLDHTPSTMSRLSPVSPWTPGTSTTTTGGTANTSPTQVGNIYEMMGSEPAEMSAGGRPAGAMEVEGSSPASEMGSPVADASAEGGVGKRDRPFSFVQTPTSAFIAPSAKEKHGPVKEEDELVDVSLRETKTT